MPGSKSFFSSSIYDDLMPLHYFGQMLFSHSLEAIVPKYWIGISLVCNKLFTSLRLRNWSDFVRIKKNKFKYQGTGIDGSVLESIYLWQRWIIKCIWLVFKIYLKFICLWVLINITWKITIFNYFISIICYDPILIQINLLNSNFLHCLVWQNWLRWYFCFIPFFSLGVSLKL